MDFSVIVHDKKVLAELRVIDRNVDRATMWTVRQAGRKVRQYSRRAAPVYRGKPRPRTVSGQHVGLIEKGDLRKSISSARNLRRIPGGFSVTVGPRGVPTVYAAIQEARRPYMAPAVSRVNGEIRQIAAVAWGRAVKRK